MKQVSHAMNCRNLRGAALATGVVVLVIANACVKKAPLPPPPSPPLAPVASLTASPQTIQRGQSSTLAWWTENATDVTIDPIGKVAARGSDIVNPTQSITYQLTATGPGGTTQVSTRITVSEPRPSP
jgi:hypothetical protein